jgi:hypothetical protein
LIVRSVEPQAIAEAQPGCSERRLFGAGSQSRRDEAEMQHPGYGTATALAEEFDAITCAERVIRCTGNGKQGMRKGHH